METTEKFENLENLENLETATPDTLEAPASEATPEAEAEGQEQSPTVDALSHPFDNSSDFLALGDRLYVDYERMADYLSATHPSLCDDGRRLQLARFLAGNNFASDPLNPADIAYDPDAARYLAANTAFSHLSDDDLRQCPISPGRNSVWPEI